MRGQIPLSKIATKKKNTWQDVNTSFFFWLVLGVELVYVKADEHQNWYEEGMASAGMLRLWKEGTGNKTSLAVEASNLLIHNMKLHAYWICTRN